MKTKVLKDQVVATLDVLRILRRDEGTPDMSEMMLVGKVLKHTQELADAWKSRGMEKEIDRLKRLEKRARKRGQGIPGRGSDVDTANEEGLSMAEGFRARSLYSEDVWNQAQAKDKEFLDRLKDSPQ